MSLIKLFDQIYNSRQVSLFIENQVEVQKRGRSKFLESIGYSRNLFTIWKRHNRGPNVAQAADMLGDLGYKLIIVPIDFEEPKVELIETTITREFVDGTESKRDLVSA